MFSKISKKFFVSIAVAVCSALIIAVSVSACSEQKLSVTGPYPNKIAEAAQISEKYKNIAEKLSEDGIEEFLALAKIPHESANMDPIRNYILNWAKTNNKNATLDSSGCIYIDVPASQGHESDKNLIIQAHMDMVVTIANGYTFDKDNSGIDVVYDKENGQIHSKDYLTSLGADDGEGLGLLLAISKNENNFTHGPIRLLFTYDEEITMAGAKNISADIINADYLINFDNSPCGLAATSAAGVLPIKFTKKYAVADPTEKGQSENFNVLVNGLKGGHAGYDITLGRLSASAFMIQYLNELKNKSIHFRLVSINCGQAHNAIPDSFDLTLNINKKHEEEATQIFNDLCDTMKKEHPNDAEFNSEIKVLDASGKFPSQQDSDMIQTVLNTIPNGLLEMDNTFKDVAKTSSNIGVIKLTGGEFYCNASYRSSSSEALDEQSIKIVNDLKASKIDFEIPTDKFIPAWPGGKSSLTDMYEKSMKEECRITPTLTAIHAGLEPAMFVQKRPTLQAISIGGDVQSEHNVSETFYTKTYPVAIVPVLYILDHINELS